jgi:hypothetical protein
MQQHGKKDTTVHSVGLKYMLGVPLERRQLCLAAILVHGVMLKVKDWWQETKERNNSSSHWFIRVKNVMSKPFHWSTYGPNTT